MMLVKATVDNEAGGHLLPSGDLVAGFRVWEVKDLADATAWRIRCSNRRRGRAKLRSSR
jgi:hypothetical protein